MTTSQQFQHFATEIEELIPFVHATFGQLSEAHLNWKPSAEKWSIAQCLQHVITNDNTYFPMFDVVKSGNYSPTLWQRIPFVPAIMGREMVKAIGRMPRRAMKTSPMFEPSRSMITREIISDFALHEQYVVDYLRFFAAASDDTGKIIIPLPITPLLIVPLSDALTVIVNHTFRHVMQAEKVLQSVNFGIV